MKAYKFIWFLLFLALIFDLILAWASWDDIRNNIGWVKNIPQKTSFKIRHIIQYSPQAFLLSFGLRKTFSLAANKVYLLSILGVTFIGILTEFIQLFRPQRIFAVEDMLWNFLAALIGASLFRLIDKKD